MTHPVIPWAKPTLWGAEKDYVQRAVESSWISGGPFVDELEKRLRELLHVPYAVAVANGTAAIHLAYLALNVQPGDEIIVPGFGFQAAANIALHMQARPVFAEVDPDTWCLTAEGVEACLSPRTVAIVPVHTYGNVCGMDEINDLARRHELAVIEDAAESFGSSYHGESAGCMGTMGCFSFQATKTITTGEGGLVVTRDAALHDRMLSYRSHGMLKKRYWHDVPGHNFRLTNMQAAFGCAQLDHLTDITIQRDRLFQRYWSRLQNQVGIVLQHFPSAVKPLLWAVACRLDPTVFPQGRDAVIQELLRAAIETRPGFYAASMQPIYETRPLPICEAIGSQVISLPTFPDLTDGEVDFICNKLLAFGVKQKSVAEVHGRAA